ncbi:MAG: amino acid adenylation domain-containing protein [Lachnospiraceae bacterium]|nr:amino acid adenylation domain-containing protein [Lachnospiraceae bacterium]
MKSTYDLTIPQQNIYNLQRRYENSSISNLCGTVLFYNQVESDSIEKSLENLTSEYDIFRLRISHTGGGKQYYSDAESLSVERKNLESQNELDKLADLMAGEPMEMHDSPLYRFVIVQLNDRTALIAVFNHLIADAWTFSLLINRFLALLSGETPEDNECRYSDFIESEKNYLQSNRYAKDKEFWEEIYDMIPEHSLIKMHESAKYPSACRKVFRRESEAQAKLLEFCSKYNYSEAIVYETALIIYLSRINSDNKRITIGLPVLNRKTIAEKKTAGMFISTIPLSVLCEDDIDILSLMEQIKEAQGRVFRHQRYPYTEILGDVRRRFGFEGNLYDVLFSYQNAKGNADVITKWHFSGYSETPLSISIDNRDSLDSDTVTIDYQTEVFSDEKEICLLIKRLEYILDQMMEKPEMQVGELDLLPSEEKKLILNEFNDTDADYPTDKCLHELFCDRVSENPGKTALIFEGREYSYQELDEKSNILASVLRSKGVGRNDIVPIVSVRSPYVVIGMMGILKAGGGFFLIDGTYPDERIEFLINECNSEVILSAGCKADGRFEIEEVVSSDKSPVSIANINDVSDYSCAIHTSGSTGVPKVTVLTHLGIINHLFYDETLIDNVEHIISSTILSFDAFIQEILLGLISNRVIVLMNDQEVYNAELFANLINKYDHSFLFSTPTKIKEFIRINSMNNFLDKVEVLVVGGEVFKPELYDLLRLHNDHCLICNGYGPAECTFSVTLKNYDHTCNSDNGITIGKPISNTRIYILDSNLTPSPVGVMGEIYVEGRDVGKGYLNQPELTSTRFIQNPFPSGKAPYCEKLYRTGDLGRWRTDGELEYLGRADMQVKIRGLRVEPGEIEGVINSFWGITLSAVCAQKDVNGRQYLAAYYTADDLIDERALRKYLSEKLPKYMIPNYFIHVAEMPMTPSAKIDRNRLPEPNISEIKKTEYVPPDKDLEKKLCRVLEELLTQSPIGIEDDFFDDLGGDSLAAITYVAKAHEAGVDFSLQNVFDHPTIKALADYLASNVDHRVIFAQSDFEKYSELLKNNKTDSGRINQKRSLGNVLLTGATGFLGAHIIDSILKLEKGDVYCLIRGADEDICRRRLESTLVYYFGNSYISEIGNRIHIVVGDITTNGLSDNLPKDIQTVIHVAASVKHFGEYEEFRRINTEGTGHVVDVAKRLNARLIHISTMSVSGNSMSDDISAYHSDKDLFFRETDLYIGQPLDNVYIRSKFEAERCVLDAMLKDVDAHIIRVGNLTNRESDLLFQPNYSSNAFLNRVKAFLELGVIPDYLMPMYVEFSPVDMTALGIVKLTEYVDKESIFHLYSDKPLYFSKMIPMLKEYGITIMTVDSSGFRRRLEETIHDPQRRYIYEAIQNDLDKDGRLLYDVSIHVKNEFTTSFLKQIGFEWKEPDDTYLRRYIEYFRGLEYFTV